MGIFLKLRYIMMLPILFLTLITSPAAKSTETAELIGTDTFILGQALIMGQGITTDGEYFYTSGSIAAIDLTALSKIRIEDMEIVDVKINPLPDKCSERGNDHIGGISYYNGKIYAPVEGGDEVYASIVVYDAKTLEHTGEIYDLPNELYPDGVPWCAVDPETGYLYASFWDEADVIHVYDVNDSMKSVRDIEVKGADFIDRIQGGEFYNGELYLSYDIHDNGNIKNIMKVDVETGEVSLAAERNVGSDNVEAEGMTFTKNGDEVILHVLDYNKIAGIFLRHYKVDF